MGIVNTLKLISKKVISEEDLLKRVSLPKNYDIKKGLLFEHSTFGVDGSSYKKEIFSIKNEFGELQQRFELRNDKLFKMSEYENSSIMDIDNYDKVKNNNYIKVKHFRKRTTEFHNGIPTEYHEIDTILSGKSDNVKYGFNKKNVLDRVQTKYDLNYEKGAEGIQIKDLSNKSKFYSRMSYYHKYDNDLFLADASSNGYDKNLIKWLDHDLYSMSRFVTDKVALAQSLVHKNKIPNIEFEFSDLPVGKCGSYIMGANGVAKITVNKNLPIEHIFKTLEHEIEHANQDRKLLNFLSNLIKDKSDNEIIEYINKNDDEISYLYKRYLNDYYGSKKDVRNFCYNTNEKYTLEKVKDLISGYKNYISADKNYELYKKNPLEKGAFEKENRAKSKQGFYSDEYRYLFTPNVPKDSLYKSFV